MRDDDEQPWRPAAPARAPAVWEGTSAPSATGPGRDPGTGADTARADGSAPADDAGTSTREGRRPPTRASSALRRAAQVVADRWRPLPPARRVGVVLGAVVVAAGLVAVGGVATGPAYAPVARPSFEVDDLRTTPTSTAWSTDLRALLAPDAQADCVGYDGSVRVGDDDVLVATSAQGYEPYSGCEDAPGQLARLDVRTGEVRWATDVADAVGVDAVGLQVTVDQAGEEALVAVQSVVGSSLARVDTSTGEVLEVLAGAADARGGADAPGGQALVVQVEGLSGAAVVVSRRLVDLSGDASVESSVADGRARFELYRADDLSTPTWTGTTGDGSSPMLVGHQLVVDGDGVAGRSGGGTEGGLQLVDARTGRTQPLPGDLRTVESWAESLGGSVVSGRADGDGDGPGQGSSVVSLDGDGSLRWSARLPSASYPAVTDACISITAPDGDVTCLDPRTGDERWTRSTGDSGRDDVQAEQVQAFFGTATDDVLTSLVTPDALAAAAAGGGRDGPRGSAEGKTVLALDARTGDVRWSTELPVASYVIATSRTTGYASTFFSSDRDSPTLIAFDLADGRVLWSTQVATSAFASAFWGPTLVQVDPDGVVHGLATGVELAG